MWAFHPLGIQKWQCLYKNYLESRSGMKPDTPLQLDSESYTTSWLCVSQFWSNKVKLLFTAPTSIHVDTNGLESLD